LISFQNFSFRCLFPIFSGDAYVLLKARSCNLSSFSLPILFNNKLNNQVLWTACGMSQISLSDQAAVPTINSPLKDSLREFSSTRVCGWPRYFGWPIIFSIFGIFTSAFLFFQTRRIKVLLLGCIILARSMILYTFSVAQDFRYALLIHILTITLIASGFLELFRSLNSSKTKI